MNGRLAAAAVVLATSGMLGAVPTATPTPTPTPDIQADPVRTAQYWLDDYGIRDAWQTTRGAGTRIAVIDTGIARGPVELGGVVDGADFSGLGSADGRTPVGAVDAAHGSLVASLAAGRGMGPDAGVIGVAPEAQLLSLSLSFGAAAATPFTDQVADAMRWAVDHDADVINLSFTTNTLDWPQSWDDAFLYAAENDVVVIVAAGNRGSGTDRVGAPATIPGVLSVGGVDRTGTASIEASTQGITIGVSAPSEDLLGVSPEGDVVMWNGTSGAAPIVAGIAALVRAAHPDLDAANVINRIVRTASPAAGASSVPDPLYGYGLVDAAAAVSAPVAAVQANPMGNLSDWIRIYRRGDAAPVPEPTAQPVEVPSLPAADPVSRPASPLLPSEESLIYGSLPLAVTTLAGILVALGVTAAARRIRSARTYRASSRPI